jgi:hypothetical protein
MKNVYLKQVFHLNASASKSLHVGLLVDGNNTKPTIVLVGDKSEIILDTAGWRTLLAAKESVLNFFEFRTDVLSVNLDCNQFTTNLKGNPGDLYLGTIYQTPKNSEKKKFMNMAEISYRNLFAIERVVSHYIVMLEKSLEELGEFLKLYRTNKRTGTAVKFEAAATSAGISLTLLYHELGVYEHLFD